MQGFRKNKKLITLLVLFLMIWVNYNTIFNTHIHILDDNRIVFHSHPFNKSTDADNRTTTHQHTNSQLLVIDLLTRALSLLLLLLVLYYFFKSLLIKTVQYSRQIVQTSVIASSISRRGPPQLLPAV